MLFVIQLFSKSLGMQIQKLSKTLSGCIPLPSISAEEWKLVILVVSMALMHPSSFFCFYYVLLSSLRSKVYVPWSADKHPARFGLRTSSNMRFPSRVPRLMLRAHRTPTMRSTRVRVRRPAFGRGHRLMPSLMFAHMFATAFAASPRVRHRLRFDRCLMVRCAAWSPP